MDRNLFAEKLGHYAMKEPRKFVQLDGWSQGAAGSLEGDVDGDSLFAGKTVELMGGSTVRILIPLDTDPLVAARILKKLRKWFKANLSEFGLGVGPWKPKSAQTTHAPKNAFADMPDDSPF
jgi:hypothetical protein